MPESPEAYGDALTVAFWEGARRRQLLLQRCRVCGAWQFYPRPFCLRCNAADVEWAAAAGTGTVYAATTVRVQISPDFTPPYVVALVDLDEGPRMLSQIAAAQIRIGQRVRVAWKEREPDPPLPVFEPF